MSQLQEIQKEMKENILQDYLAGMEIKEIAAKYGFKHIRNVYYHLQPLKTSHKIAHLKSIILRMEEQERQENKEETVS